MTIRCSRLSNSIAVGGENTNTDILVSVPNDGEINGKISYRNDTKIILNNLSILTILEIKLPGEEPDDLIDFQGVSTYFIIQFDIYRKRRERPPLFRDVNSKVYSEFNIYLNNIY